MMLGMLEMRKMAAKMGGVGHAGDGETLGTLGCSGAAQEAIVDGTRKVRRIGKALTSCC